MNKVRIGINTKKAGVYIIASTESNKTYIGSTVDLGRRRRRHRHDLRHGKHSSPHLQAAWNKYGEATFEFGVLEYLDDSEELHLAEQFWMDLYQEEGRELYNYGPAARHGVLNTHHTEEHRHRIGKAHKGRFISKEYRRKISETLMGHSVSEQTRRKIGEASRGRQCSEQTRRKMGVAQAGYYPSFINRETGEVIPAGMNLRAMCRGRKLHDGCMGMVKAGKRKHHKGWILVEVASGGIE